MKRNKSRYQEKQIEQNKRVDFELKPMNSRQKEYINMINHLDVVMATGYAGTSKTYCAAVIAAEMFANKEIKQIIICRPYEGCGRSVGLLPGDANMKLMPVVAPIIDIFNKYLGVSAVKYAIEHDQIKLVAPEFIRGLTFDDAFCLFDEAQNTDVNTMKALLTRIGINCKVVLSGDINQIDLRNKSDSGLAWLMRLTEAKPNLKIGHVSFDHPDHIVRSGFVKEFIIATENFK